MVFFRYDHIRFWYLRCCGCPGLRGRYFDTIGGALAKQFLGCTVCLDHTYYFVVSCDIEPVCLHLSSLLFMLIIQ